MATDAGPLSARANSKQPTMPEEAPPVLVNVPPSGITHYPFQSIGLPTADELLNDPGTEALLDWYDTQAPSANELAAVLAQGQPDGRKQEAKFAR